MTSAERTSFLTGQLGRLAIDLDSVWTRQWLHAEIAQWLDSSTRVGVVVGPPGTGKSVLLADLIAHGISGRTNQPQWVFHFCRADDDVSLLSDRVISHLADQLTVVPEYVAAAAQRPIEINSNITFSGPVGDANQVTGVRLSLADESPEKAIDRLLRRPLVALDAAGGLPAEVVIVVDALDEALSTTTGEQFVGALARAASADGWPASVRFLFSSRPDQRVLRWLEGPSTTRVALGADPRADEDVYAYALARLSAATDVSARAEFAGRLRDAANGVFLYARLVIDDALTENGRLRMPAGPLPSGLAGYYAQTLDRELTRTLETWEERYRPLLGLLAVARSPGLTAAELSAISRVPRSRVDDAVVRLASLLLRSEDGSLRIFHQSLVDFLLLTGPHNVYAAEAHQELAAYLERTGGDRARRDLVWHLAGAGDVPGLDRVLTAQRLSNSPTMDQFAAHTQDLNLAARAAADGGDPVTAIKWAWVAAARNDLFSELIRPDMIPLLALAGLLDDAVGAALRLDLNQDSRDETVAAVAARLVDAGRADDAVNLVQNAAWHQSSDQGWGAVIAALAASDPGRAHSVAAAHADAIASSKCLTALGMAAGECRALAIDRAGTDAERLRELARAIGSIDVGAGIEVAQRIKPSYERAAGRKVLITSQTAIADIVADLSGRDFGQAAKLLDDLVRSGELSNRDEAAVAGSAVTIAAASIGEPIPIGSVWHKFLDEYANDGPPQAIIAAATLMSGGVPAGPEKSSKVWSMSSELNIVSRLDLSPLTGNPAAADAMRAYLLDLAERVIQRDNLEYVGSGIGALAAALGSFDLAAAEDVVVRGGNTAHATSQGNSKAEATLTLVKSLPPERWSDALRLASNAGGYFQHLATVALVEGLASAGEVETALSVIDEIDRQYSTTRVILVGTLAGYLGHEQARWIPDLQRRLPQPGESAAFRGPFADTAGALIAAIHITEPDRASQLEEWIQPEAGSESASALTELGRAAQAARSDPTAALEAAMHRKPGSERSGAILGVLLTGRIAVAEFPKPLREAFEYVDRFEPLRRPFTELARQLINADPRAGLDLMLSLQISVAWRRELLPVVARAVAREQPPKDAAATVLGWLSSELTETRTLEGWLVTLLDPFPQEWVTATMFAAEDLDLTLPFLLCWSQADRRGALAMQLHAGQQLYFQDELLRRAGTGGFANLVAAFAAIDQPDQDDVDGLTDAVDAAARAEPTTILRAVSAHEWPTVHDQDRAIVRALMGMARSEPQLAVEELPCRYASDTETIIKAIGESRPTLGVEPWRRLIRIADDLDPYYRTTSFAALASALAGLPTSGPEVVADLAAQVGSRGGDGFQRCVADLVLAVASDPVQRTRLVDMMESVRALVAAGSLQLVPA